MNLNYDSGFVVDCGGDVAVALCLWPLVRFLQSLASSRRCSFISHYLLMGGWGSGGAGGRGMKRVVSEYQSKQMHIRTHVQNQ